MWTYRLFRGHSGARGKREGGMTRLPHTYTYRQSALDTGLKKMNECDHQIQQTHEKQLSHNMYLTYTFTYI